MQTHRKHTPGPWRVTGDNIRSDYHPNGPGALLFVVGPHFHEYVPSTNTQAANLALVAAAPELLAALEAAVKWRDSPKLENENWSKQARAAIAKAILIIEKEPAS